MTSSLPSAVRFATAALLVVFFAISPNEMFAQQHVIDAMELQQQLIAASQARARDLQTVQQFLGSAKAQSAMRAAKMDPTRVTTAVASLSNAELAQIASRATAAQADFAAGRMDDRDLLLILVGIAALILIIVAVR
jgi:hypothetical protein